MNVSNEALDVTVAATENLLDMFEVPGGGAPAGSTWEELPKTSVRAFPSETLREVLNRAADQLGIESGWATATSRRR